MKKIVTLVAALMIAAVAQAQDENQAQSDTQNDFGYSWTRRAWFGFRLSESFRLNKWNDIDFADRHMPRRASTDLKASLNVMFAGPIGFFGDLGVGFMPGAKDNGYKLGNFPTPKQGTQYYVRDKTFDNAAPDPSASFKMTFGLTARIRASDKLYVLPCFGVGFMTLKQPGYDLVLKEDGSNTQYTANYRWFKEEYSDGDVQALGYLTGKLLFAYPLSHYSRLLFGVEYNWIFTPADLYVTFTNDFNTNITRTFKYPGKKMNMLGLTVGIAL